MKRHLRRALSLLCVLAMCIGLLPSTALAVGKDSSYDLHVYLLKPGYTIDSQYSASNWYYIGEGSVSGVNAPTASNREIYDFSSVNYSLPSGANYPNITVNGKEYTYAASGDTAGTYTIEWVR